MKTMAEQADLPDDVIAAIRQQRKIEAIKILREHRGIGLKEAKDAVEGYLRDNPQPHASARTESGIGRFFLVLAVALVVYLAYNVL